MHQSDFKLRYGIMCNGYFLKKWQIKVVENLKSLDFVELSLIIINDENPETKKSLINKIKGIFKKDFVFKLYNRFFFNPDSIKIIDTSSIFRDIKSIKCKTEKKGKYSEYFIPSDIDVIRNFNLDFILRFGFNIIKGEILQVSKYGVWSFHHSDEQKYRGGPPGFWEIYKKDKVSAFILQKLTDKLDSGLLLKKGFIDTVLHSYQHSIDKLFMTSAIFPKQVCIDLKNRSANYFNCEPINTNAKIFKQPSNLQSISFIIKLIKNRISFHFNELFFAEQWNFGVIEKPIIDIITDKNPDITWMCTGRKDFYADCACFKNNDELQIVFENYSFKKSKAKISIISYKKNKYSNIKEVILSENHLAYPYIFEYQNETYCIPESYQDNSVKLFKFDSFENKFVFIKNLIDNIDAIDSTLFYYNNFWWLFFTRKAGDLSNSALYAYYSENIFGEYKSHENNPVKIDISSSRPAGKPFYFQGFLYRPSQNSSTTYGGKIMINKINILTIKEFNETTEFIISPFKSKFDKGIHTINSVDNFTVIDGKKYIFVWNSFINKLFKKISNIFCK